MLLKRKFLSGVVFILAAGLLAALVPSSASADAAPPTDWSQFSGSGPSARIAAYMAYDSTRNRVVLFGGAVSSTQYDADTWEFDGTAWTQINASGPPPGGLGNMAFDSARGVSVLFGGGDANSTLAPITWEWNGTSWTPRFTATRPPPRVWSGMAYDSDRHVMVLFGGGQAGGVYLNDTWEYDGTDWHQVATAHAPPARYAHGLAYDPVRKRTVMFGGWANGRLNDTWEYDGADWVQVAATNPPAPRFNHSMAYDAALGKVLVFGGDYIVGGTLGPNNETWLYDGAAWHQLATATVPSARVMAAAAYDSRHASFVILGGTQEGFPQVPLGDTWMLHTPLAHATLSTTSVAFGVQPVMSTSAQNVTLTNSGDAPLAISAISQATGDFNSTDSCPRSPATLAAGASCTVTVSFSPSLGNTSTTEQVTITDNSDAGSQSIALSGSGQWGFLNPLQNPLDFGASPINPSGPTATAMETVTVPSSPTIVLGVFADFPFIVTGFDCPTGVVIAVGTTCHAQLAFQPSAAGAYSTQLRIIGNTPRPTTVDLTGTATPLQLTLGLQASPSGTFGQTLAAKVNTNATSGTATFTFNGTPVGSAVALSGAGSASQQILLDESTIPAGAGTYLLVVSVHPTDGVHSDASVSQSVTIVPATVQMSWTGTGLSVAGNPVTLAATVTSPAGSHVVWVRFEVTDSAGIAAAYYAQVAGSGAASISVNGLAPGAYTVRARLVFASGSSLANGFVTSEDLRSTFAVQPARGGYVAGAGAGAAFEIEPGPTPTGSLRWVEKVPVTGSDGQQHDAYRIISSTSITSLRSHSHVATATGNAAITVVDATTGVLYSSTTSTFQLSIAADGSVSIAAGGASASLPPGSGVNHL